MTRSRTVVALLVPLAVLAAACSDSVPDLPRGAQERLEEPGPPGADTDLAITGAFDLAPFVGQPVTIPGRVREVVAPGVFRLRSDVFGGGSVLVVGPQVDAIAPDTMVRVAGGVVPVDELDQQGGPPGTVDAATVAAQPDAFVVLATEVRPAAEAEQG